MHTTIGAMVAIGMAIATPAFTQELPGNVAAGQALAVGWCRDCHQVGVPDTLGGSAGPAFRDVANRTSTTALSLRVFLQSTHPSMPNIQFTTAQTDDIVAYLLSLKGR